MPAQLVLGSTASTRTHIIASAGRGLCLPQVLPASIISQSRYKLFVRSIVASQLNGAKWLCCVFIGLLLMFTQRFSDLLTVLGLYC